MNFYKIISKIFSYCGGMDCAGKLPLPQGTAYVSSASSLTSPRQRCPGYSSTSQNRKGTKDYRSRPSGRQPLGFPGVPSRFLQERRSTDLRAMSHYLAIKSPVTGSAAPGSQGLLVPISSGWRLLSSALLYASLPPLQIVLTISLLMCPMGPQILAREKEGRTYAGRGHEENEKWFMMW